MAGFDPNQPRNEDGEWTETVANAAKEASKKSAAYQDVETVMIAAMSAQKMWKWSALIRSVQATLKAMNYAISEEDLVEHMKVVVGEYAANKDTGTSTMIRWMGTAKGGEPVFSLEDRKRN